MSKNIFVKTPGSQIGLSEAGTHRNFLVWNHVETFLFLLLNWLINILFLNVRE